MLLGKQMRTALASFNLGLPLSCSSGEILKLFLKISINPSAPFYGKGLIEIYENLARAVCGAVLSGMAVKCLTCSND